MITPREASLIDSIANLVVGEEMARVQTLLRDDIRKNTFSQTKRSMTNTITKTIARVKERYPGRVYRMSSHHHIKDDLDAVVVVVIKREPDFSDL